MGKPASFSREDLAEIVARKLVTYDADKTGLFDFALESAGGTVETVRCTKTYSTTSAVYTVFGIPVWSEGKTMLTSVQHHKKARPSKFCS